MDVAVNVQTDQTYRMPPKSDSDVVIPPEVFVSLKYCWDREKGASLEAWRLDGTPLRLQGVSEDEIKHVREALKEIDRQIDDLRKRLKK